LKKEAAELCDSLSFAMRMASRDALAIRAGDMGIEQKGPLDTVTAADKRVEAILTNYVAVHHPNDGVLAEEGTTRPSKSGRVWYFDPIDGTKNYTMKPKNPFFGISAGRGENGVSIDGGIRLPMSGEFLFASRGQGACVEYWEGGVLQPLSREPFTRTLKESVVAIGLTPDREDLFKVFRANCWNALAFGSFVCEAMMVVRGVISAYVHTGATQFDVAAATLIAEEAGCAVSRLDGKQVDLREKKIPVAIAANENLLAEVLELCNR
jgi:myo-inositol-1(or 4)-monophosphatase